MTTITLVAKEWGLDPVTLGQLIGITVGLPELDISAEEPPIWLEMFADPIFFQLPSETLTAEEALTRESLIRHEAELREQTPLQDRVDFLIDQSRLHSASEGLMTVEEAVDEMAWTTVVNIFQTLGEANAKRELALFVLQNHGMVIRGESLLCNCSKWRAASSNPPVQAAEFRTHMREVVADFLSDFPEIPLPESVEEFRPIKVEVINPSPADWEPSTNTTGIPVLVPPALLTTEKENHGAPEDVQDSDSGRS